MQAAFTSACVPETILRLCFGLGYSALGRFQTVYCVAYFCLKKTCALYGQYNIRHAQCHTYCILH